MILFNKKNKKLPGFSLGEILIVVALISLVAASSLPIYANFHGKAQLNENSSMIVQTLRQARESSFVRVENYNYGVKFLNSSYVLYKGASYAARVTSSDQVFTLDSALSLSTNLSDDEVVFSRGVGRPSSDGTIVLTHSALGTKNIIVNSAGMISLQ